MRPSRHRLYTEAADALDRAGEHVLADALRASKPGRREQPRDDEGYTAAERRDIDRYLEMHRRIRIDGEWPADVLPSLVGNGVSGEKVRDLWALNGKPHVRRYLKEHDVDVQHCPSQDENSDSL